MSEKNEKFFIITIDAEADNLWSYNPFITTKNAKFLHRFQTLCEKYNFKPTYLTDYPMSQSEHFREFGRDVIKRNVGEIGMHLHAYHTPPIIPLTDNDALYMPYVTEYPPMVIKDKINAFTDILEDIFGVKMVSHRAGRWSINEACIRHLQQKGYLVDCSVTPNVSFQKYKGDPKQTGGKNYYGFPKDPYFVNLNNIKKIGNSTFLEVPVTIDTPPFIIEKIFSLFNNNSLIWRIMNRIYRYAKWLRPDGKNIRQMLQIVNNANKEDRICLEFMLHSSELMPGGSPTFQNENSIEKLYQDLEILFETISKTYKGLTLFEFYNWFRKFCAHKK